MSTEKLHVGDSSDSEGDNETYEEELISKPDAKKVFSLSHNAWKDDKYLKPVIEDDELLQWDIEEDENSLLTDELTLEEKLKLAEQRAERSEDELKKVVEDLHRLQETAKNLFSSTVETAELPTVKSLKDDEDSPYIDSYSHFGIHREMLQDTVRTLRYKEAICLNEETLADKLILDVGSGTGILSMFCAKAGAKKVYAVEMSDIYYESLDIIRENKLEDKIHQIKGRLENIQLPEEKVDVIVSEWMGYFLFFESMLDSVLYARDKYLKSDGIMLPNICTLKIMAMTDEELYKRHITFWDDVYGFRMSCLRKQELGEALVDFVKKTSIVSDESELISLNLNECSIKDTEFKSLFKLTCQHSTTVHALCAYFDVDFKMPKPVRLSTSPFEKGTHWKHTVFFLKHPIEVKEHEEISGTLECLKGKKNPRSLTVKIHLKGVDQIYSLS
ncbi:DgyrCDS7650 [Dimorphilus gyrociliatus]|uniref:type I protein arginine methyltransferase n=1 Tax=Dimorphilus gyrociliatus TaxID=2664684 RepID=A0A7I8VRN4_9ANNE|nr:DgyrCDS7650 [Dimorphilus gyrociliatus]